MGVYMFDPTPGLKRGMLFIALIFIWFVYLFFEPFSALITAAFLMAAIFISLKNF